MLIWQCVTVAVMTVALAWVATKTKTSLPSGKRTFASRRFSNLDQKIADQLDKLGTHAGSPGTLLPSLKRTVP
jgi:hypothetical protein